MLPEQLFATGCVWDAYSYVCDLVRSAARKIVLIDNFMCFVDVLGQLCVKKMAISLSMILCAMMIGGIV